MGNLPSHSKKSMVNILATVNACDLTIMEAAGLKVVMDHCPAIELNRLGVAKKTA